MTLSVGTAAPTFTLRNAKREEVSLSSYRGRNVVLAFFPGAFTGVCTAEVCALRDSLAELNDSGADVLGITVDAPAALGAFSEKNALIFPLLSDYKREVVAAYGILLEDFAGMPGYSTAKRSVFVLDREGVVRYAWVGPNPGVEPDYAEVKAAVKKLG